MSDIYANMPAPKAAGDYPEQFKFINPNDQIEGTVVDVRFKEADDRGDGCPVVDIATADGNRWSVFAGPTALYREIYNKRPAPGQAIRIIFKGYSGKAKLFQVDVAGTAAPAAPPTPTAPAEQPFPQSAPLPTPQAQPAPAAPWGAPPPAANGAPPAAPWGQ
jgi:hypothetical protein